MSITYMKIENVNKLRIVHNKVIVINIYQRAESLAAINICTVKQMEFQCKFCCFG